MSHKMIKAGLIAATLTLFASTAMAQTSMQRRAAEEERQAEQEETTTEETTTEETTSRTQRQAPATTQERQRQQRDIEVVGSQWSRVHMPGFRFDVGYHPGDMSPVGIGLGYMYALEWNLSVMEESAAVIRFGVGPDLTLVTDSFDGVEGLTAYMRGRASAISDGAGGITLEGGAGIAIEGAGMVIPITLGAYYAWTVFEVGYFVQIPVIGPDRDWLALHNIGLRLHIPLLRH